MRKYSKMLIFAMLALALMASSAFAGAINYYGSANAVNVPFNVALEAMGAARNITQVGSSALNVLTNAPITIIPGQALASGSLLTVSFTNAGFDGSQVFLCEINGTTGLQNNLLTPLASPTSTANATNLSFVMSRSTGGTNYLVMTTAATANTTNCVGNASDAAFTFRIQPVTSAAMASISYIAAIGGTTYDSASAKNFANIAKQYVTNYVSGNATIDFSGNSASNGSRLLSAALAATNAALPGNTSINMTAMNVQTNAAGMTNAGLTVSAILSLQDSASWQGVQRVYLDAASGANTCALAANNAVNSSPSGTVNLAYSLFTGAASTAQINVCADVTGNAVLQTRTIKGSWDITVGSGGNDPAADSFTQLMSWTPNGYQGIIPYISASSTYGTICFINNKSLISAGVTIDILTTESGATLTSLQALSVGSVGSGKTIRVDLSSAITPYSYSGTTETAGTATTLTGLQSNDRYSAQINVGAAPAQVTVNCLQLDPAGSKRAVPVLTQADGAAFPWQQ